MKAAHFVLFGLFLTFPLFSRAQVGIGTVAPAASAALDIVSTARGILIPRLTLAQRNAIPNPATGLLVFQSDTDAGFFYFDGSAWNKFAVSTPTSSSSNETLVYTTQGF